jgi:hypothetical protein
VYAVALALLALAQPAPAPALSAAEPIVGTVEDASGKPIPSADVWLSSGLSPGDEGPLVGRALWIADGRASVPKNPPVLARVHSDERGRFRFELPAEVMRSQEPLPLALWAFRAGGQVASRRLRWAIPPPADPVKLVLSPAAAANFRVVAPDATPAAGAVLFVTALDRVAVPEDLAARFAARTDSDGRAELTAFAPGAIRRIRVESPMFGTQIVHVATSNSAGPTTITLERAGRISGRVVTDDAKPASGLRLRARTFPDGFDSGGTVGSAEVATDGSGRFEIPAIAAGRLDLALDFESRPDLPYRGLAPKNLVIEAGLAASVEIALKRVVRIEGLVRERGTGLPIAGVSPEIPDPASRQGDRRKVVTDASGHFAGYMEGQQPFAFLYRTPKPFFIPADAPENFNLLPAGATSFTLPPIELVRGVQLRGTVVDETGKPVAEALVRASWNAKDSVPQWVSSATDGKGSFLLEGLDPLADLSLTAEADGLATAAPQSARVGAAKPPRLVVSRANTVVLAGRILDAAGRPIGSAEVRIMSQTRIREGRVWRSDPIEFVDRASLRTDADGRFVTPHGVRRGLEYAASVTARGLLPGRTVWLKAGGGATAEFPDLTLRRLQAVAGIVRDRQGRPIAGATVFQSGDGPMRTRAVSDDQGRFQLPGVIEGKAIILARKEGFRFHGQPIDTAAGSVEIVLLRTDDNPAALATLPSVLPRDEELALGRRLLAPYVQKVMARGSDADKYQASVTLAAIDPKRTLELIETEGKGKPRFALDALLSAVAVGMVEESPDEAMSIAETVQDPGARSWCLLGIFDKLPSQPRARKVEVLAQAQLQAKGIKQPEQKLRMLGRLVDRWLDLGERDRALALLNEGKALAKEVPPPGYELTTFAEALARVDLPAALALNDAARDSARRGDRVSRVFVFDRSYGEIAYRLARRDPAGSERVLSLIVDPFRRGGYVVAACWRMAAADLPRARRLVETIEDPFQQAYALGLMARALASADKAMATRLLDLAFERLEAHRDDTRSYSAPAAVAAVLLSAVEQIDPARVQETVWRAVALREPRLEERGEGTSGRADAELAMSLARYDRAAAAAVLARAIAAFGTTGVDTYRQGLVAAALVLIDPHRAVALVETMPDDPGTDRELPKNNARRLVVEMLGKRGDARWKSARDWGISLWLPEGIDL